MGEALRPPRCSSCPWCSCYTPLRLARSGTSLPCTDRICPFPSCWRSCLPRMESAGCSQPRRNAPSDTACTESLRSGWWHWSMIPPNTQAPPMLHPDNIFQPGMGCKSFFHCFLDMYRQSIGLAGTAHLCKTDQLDMPCPGWLSDPEHSIVRPELRIRKILILALECPQARPVHFPHFSSPRDKGLR